MKTRDKKCPMCDEKMRIWKKRIINERKQVDYVTIWRCGWCYYEENPTNGN